MEEKKTFALKKTLFKWIIDFFDDESKGERFPTSWIIKRIFKSEIWQKQAIELIVIGSIFLALGTIWYFNPPFHWKSLFLIPLVVAFYRIGEIIVYQFFALIVTTRKNLYSPGRMLMLLILNYFEIILWFAFFYRILYEQLCLRGEPLTSFSFYESVYFSVVTMTTLGYGDLTPNSTLTMFIISAQTLIGLYIALVIVARFIPFLKRKKRKKIDKFTIEEEKNKK